VWDSVTGLFSGSSSGLGSGPLPGLEQSALGLRAWVELSSQSDIFFGGGVAEDPNSGHCTF
jgi:hypothetical protein